MAFLGNEKRTEAILEDNASAFVEAKSTLFELKYKEVLTKYLRSKSKSKELSGTNQGTLHILSAVELH